MRALAVAALALAIITGATNAAADSDRGAHKCDSGSAKKVAHCVYDDIKGGVPGHWSKVKKVVECESGWNAHSGGANATYAGLYQEMKVEHKDWSIPGASSWMRQWLKDNPKKRSAKGRLDAKAASIVTLAHVSKAGWDYLGPGCS